LKRLAAFLWMILLCAPAFVSSQTHDFGGLLEVGFEQRIVKGLNFGIGAEGRFNQCFTNFNRLKLSADLSYSFWDKRFKVSVGGRYLLYNQEGTPENRGRVLGSITYTERIRQFKPSFRLRIQSTFYDEQRRHVKFNPKTYLRGRLQLEYVFPAHPMTLYASTEFFLRLYKKDANIVDRFRTIVGWDYRLNAGSTIGVFFRADNEMQVAKPENVYYIGFKYGFKHK
jgi:hypothetical protein